MGGSVGERGFPLTYQYYLENPGQGHAGTWIELSHGSSAIHTTYFSFQIFISVVDMRYELI